MYHEKLHWLKAWHVAVLAQYGFAALLLVIPFGFDHPSSWGLDFNHAVIALVVLAGFTLTALGVSIADRSLAGCVIALAIPAALFWLG